MNQSLFQQEESKRRQGGQREFQQKEKGRAWRQRLSLQLRSSLQQEESKREKDLQRLRLQLRPSLQEESKREKERAWRQKDQSSLQELQPFCRLDICRPLPAPPRPSLNQWSASYVMKISISLMQAS